MITKRGLLGSLIGIVAAPAVVRASSLMPVHAPKIITATTDFEPIPFNDLPEPWYMRRIREEVLRRRVGEELIRIMTERYPADEILRTLSREARS